MNTAHFFSFIGPIIARYICLKRALGRKYINEYKILKRLDAFLSINQQDLTAESFAEWCNSRRSLSPAVQVGWMRVIRNFCLYRKRTELSCFVPDLSQFSLPHRTIYPHIFTEEEIIRLLHATKELKPFTASPLCQENYRLCLILLYTSGLRSGELIRLKIGDYDSKEHTLLIRDTKFNKSRLLPLSNDAWKELESLLKIRRKLKFSPSADSPLIWNNYKKGGSYSGNAIRRTFQSLFHKANIHTIRDGLPRLHDFRHTFAVHALLRWYREGLDVQAKLPLLAIYMGHVSIISTQYYLQYLEEVVSTANERFAKIYSKLVKPVVGGVL